MSFCIADVEVSFQRIPGDDLHWKNQVIIACTITVAVEMVLITMMLMCWRQIRWTLLKLTCSCVRLSHVFPDYSAIFYIIYFCLVASPFIVYSIPACLICCWWASVRVLQPYVPGPCFSAFISVRFTPVNPMVLIHGHLMNPLDSPMCWVYVLLL